MEMCESLEDHFMVLSTWLLLRKNWRVKDRFTGGAKEMANRTIGWLEGPCLIIKFHDRGTLSRVVGGLLYNLRGRTPSLRCLIRMSVTILARSLGGGSLNFIEQANMHDRTDIHMQKPLRAQSHSQVCLSRAFPHHPCDSLEDA